MSICFDTNILLDVLLIRQPFVNEAGPLFEAVERQRCQGLLTTSTFTTLIYFLDRAYEPETVRQILADVLSLFEIVPIDRDDLTGALRLKWHDLEDAVLHEAARRAGATGLVTRNTEDFRQATVPIYTPTELLALLNR